MSITKLKQRARAVLKTHYWILILICLFGSFIGVEQSVSLNGLRSLLSISGRDSGYFLDYKVQGYADIVRYIESLANGEYSIEDFAGSLKIDSEDLTQYVDERTGALEDYMRDNIKDYQELIDKIPKSTDELKDTVTSTTEELLEAFAESINANGKEPRTATRLGPIDLGTTEGYLAQIINSWTSGSILNRIFTAILSIGASESAATIILIVLVLLVWSFIWFFVIRIFLVVSRRFFLESRTYARVPGRRLFFFARVKKWFRVTFSLFVTTLVNLLWWLTIVGGVIMYYAYAMVPYILAENPSLNARQAMKLSRTLMKGHKWKLFLLNASFLGYRFLSFFTIGLLDILYTNPYQIATETEFYADLRANAIANGLEGSELLNDRYLYEKAEIKEIQDAYADLIKEGHETRPVPERYKGVAAFFANNFGIVFKINKEEKERVHYAETRSRAAATKEVLLGNIYPERLFNSTTRSLPDIQFLHYLRRYSIWSLILMFFCFSFIGWLWEVSLHLVEDGVFVNRGVLTGPWLPIYGSGGILMLVLLYRLRRKPLLEVGAIVVLAGVVEYLTSWFLEYRYGLKWWDYTGYFINVNGRICAEGLLVFALGGLAMVYVLAPLLDNMFRRIKLKVVVPICIVLMIIFTVDAFASRSNPNTGAGITDYGVEKTVADAAADSAAGGE